MDQTAVSPRETIFYNLSLLPRHFQLVSQEKSLFNYSSLFQVIGDKSSSWETEQALLLKTSTTYIEQGIQPPRMVSGDPFLGGIYTDSSLWLKCPVNRRLGHWCCHAPRHLSLSEMTSVPFIFFRSFKKNWKSFLLEARSGHLCGIHGEQWAHCPILENGKQKSNSDFSSWYKQAFPYIGGQMLIWNTWTSILRDMYQH